MTGICLTRRTKKFGYFSKSKILYILSRTAPALPSKLFRMKAKLPLHVQCLFTKIKRFNFDGSTEAVHLSKNENPLSFE